MTSVKKPSQTGAATRPAALSLEAPASGAAPSKGPPPIAALGPTDFTKAPETTRWGRPLPNLDPAATAALGPVFSPEVIDWLYGSVLPATVAISSRNKAAQSVTVRFIDRSGQDVGDLSRTVHVDNDGSLVLSDSGDRVDPPFRGYGVSVIRMLNEVKLLQHLSPHPNTRIVLRAGETIGRYVQAALGFDFSRESDCSDYQTRFPDWLNQQIAGGALKHNGEPVQRDDRLVSKLVKASRTWKHSWDIAYFDVKGLTVDTVVEGSELTCGIGKAFMLTEQPDWSGWPGVFYVNQKDSPAHPIFNAYTTKTLTAAAGKRAGRLEELIAALEDQATRPPALRSLVLEGEPSWIPELLKAKAQWPDAAIELQQVVEAIEGTADFRFARSLAIDSPYVAERLRSMALMLKLDGSLDFSLLQPLLDGSEPLLTSSVTPSPVTVAEGWGNLRSLQIRYGRYLFHEHPDLALQAVKLLLERESIPTNFPSKYSLAEVCLPITTVTAPIALAVIKSETDLKCLKHWSETFGAQIQHQLGSIGSDPASISKVRKAVTLRRKDLLGKAAQ